MEFEKMTIKEFKEKFSIDFLVSNNLSENYNFLLNTMRDEKCDYNYYSASLNIEDVIYDLTEEDCIALLLGVKLIEVEGIYLALYKVN